MVMPTTSKDPSLVLPFPLAPKVLLLASKVWSVLLVRLAATLKSGNIRPAARPLISIVAPATRRVFPAPYVPFESTSSPTSPPDL